MKNKYMQRTAAALLGLLILLGTAQSFVQAQENANEVAEVTGSRFVRSVEGTWQTTVTQRNCQTGDVIRTFKGLSVYHEGGTMSETSAALPPAARSAGYGVWEKQSSTTYTSSFLFQRFNPDGSYAGTQKTTSSIVMVRGGSGYETTTSIQVYDANDTLLGTGCATATASRFE